MALMSQAIASSNDPESEYRMPRDVITILGCHDVPLVADRWQPPARVQSRGSIVMLHGGGQTRHSWRKSGATFAQGGWTVLTVDARGHGDSGWDPYADYSFDALIDDLRRLTATLADVPVVIGASLGGLTALLEAGENPDSMRAVVLVDITPRLERDGAERILEFMSSAPDGFASLEEVSEAIAAYNPHRPRPTSLDGLRKNVRQRENGRWYWHWDPKFLGQSDEATSAQHLDRLEQAARGIKVPTMLVRGRHSDVVSEQGVEEMRALIPHARVEQANAGHMIAGDDNSVFAEHVLDFLEELA